MSPSAAPIVAADVRAARAAADPRAAISAAAEMAPFLPRADILVGGHAWAARRSPAPLVPVRLRVGLDGRPPRQGPARLRRSAAATAAAPQPFLPCRSATSALDEAATPANPAGVDHAPARAQHHRPRRPARAAGLGPIAARWPARQRRLSGADRAAMRAPWPVVPDGFDWAYFQAAPADQQAPYLRGNRWILIEGMHPDLGHIEAWLRGPRRRGAGRVQGAAQPQVLPLVADMLVIDADRWLSLARVARQRAAAEARRPSPASGSRPGSRSGRGGAVGRPRQCRRSARRGGGGEAQASAAASGARGGASAGGDGGARSGGGVGCSEPTAGGRGATDHPLSGTCRRSIRTTSSRAPPCRSVARGLRGRTAPREGLRTAEMPRRRGRRPRSRGAAAYP